MKFIVIKAFSGLEIGTIIEGNSDYGKTFVKDLGFGKTEIKLSAVHDLIGEYVEPYEAAEIKVEQVEMDDTLRQHWKMSVNLHCTEKRLAEIKKIIENSISRL